MGNPAVAPGHRRPLDGAVLREILEADDAAVGLHVGGDPPGDAAAVERVGAFRRDRPQRRGVVLVDEPLAGTRHPAVRAGRCAPLPGNARAAPAFAQRRGQRLVEFVAVRGKRNRRRHQLRPAESAGPVAAVQVVEAGDDAGNVGGRRPIVHETAVAEDRRVGQRRVDRRLVLVVDHHRLAHAVQEQQRHAVAADARRVRLDDAERERDGDRGVDDVAALREHAGAGFARQAMAGDDHRVLRADRRPHQRLPRHQVVDDALQFRAGARRGRLRAQLDRAAPPTRSPTAPPGNRGHATAARCDRRPASTAPASGVMALVTPTAPASGGSGAGIVRRVKPAPRSNSGGGSPGWRAGLPL